MDFTETIIPFPNSQILDFPYQKVSIFNFDGGTVKTRPIFTLLVYFISFNSPNDGEFFWRSILKDCVKVNEKKKKIVVLCSRPP